MANDVFLVFTGLSTEFENVEDAEQYAGEIAAQCRHATIISVKQNWRNEALVAENRGVIIVTPEDVILPPES